MESIPWFPGDNPRCLELMPFRALRNVRASRLSGGSSLAQGPTCRGLFSISLANRNLRPRSETRPPQLEVAGDMRQELAKVRVVIPSRTQVKTMSVIVAKRLSFSVRSSTSVDGYEIKSMAFRSHDG
jgi:hypothetical protein